MRAIPLSIFLSIPIAAAAAAVVYLYDPAAGGFYPACLFYKFTGLYCPGCGSTRALHQLFHGNLAAAFKLNPLAVSALPLLIFGILAEMGVFFARPRRLPYLYAWVFFAVIVLFWILRNIPAEPFTYLRPR
jgi:hypothetical protein